MDKIEELLKSYARAWEKAGVEWECEYQDSREIAKQIRQLLGRELFEYDWDEEGEKIISEVCKLEGE